MVTATGQPASIDAGDSTVASSDTVHFPDDGESETAIECQLKDVGQRGMENGDDFLEIVTDNTAATDSGDQVLSSQPGDSEPDSWASAEDCLPINTVPADLPKRADSQCVCTICGRGFRSRSGLFYHKKSQHTSDARDAGSFRNLRTSLRCNICGDYFNHRSSLFYHKQMHQKTLFRCTCLVTFTTKSNLRRHLRIFRQRNESGHNEME